MEISDAVKTDIQNAINAGKEVTVSKRNITLNGWTGVGYIIMDPETGEAAYMISGGTNGAWMEVASAVGQLGLFIICSLAVVIAVSMILIAYKVVLPLVLLSMYATAGLCLFLNNLPGEAKTVVAALILIGVWRFAPWALPGIGVGFMIKVIIHALGFWIKEEFPEYYPE